MAQQAQETFVAELADGTSVRVAKGEVFADAHELVKRDRAGTGGLFKRLDLGEEEAPPPPAKEPRASRVQARGAGKP